jgi:hypothetical protein
MERHPDGFELTQSGKDIHLHGKELVETKGATEEQKAKSLSKQMDPDNSFKPVELVVPVSVLKKDKELIQKI